MKHLRPSIRYLSDKRGRKRLRRLRLLRARARQFVQNRALLGGYESPAVGLLAGIPKGKTPAKPEVEARFVVKIPEEFSLIQNPSETIQTAVDLASAVRAKRVREVFFDHSKMSAVDLAAESILDHIAVQVDREYRSRERQPVRFGGRYPRDPDLKRFLRAVGIIQSLEVSSEYLPQKEQDRLRIFRAEGSKLPTDQIQVGAPDRKGVVSARFVNYINACLRDHNRRLRRTGVNRLLKYVGEVFANAEDHSGLGSWSIAGYLDNDRRDHVCEIAIFNFGLTIAETMMDVPVGSAVFNEIRPYIDEHVGRSFFGPGWSEEDLLTLVALQEHVSRLNFNPGDHRGQGTVDLIEFFQQVHRECVGLKGPPARMAIVSGSTHILFDGTYKMRADTSAPPASRRRVIAFNAENDLRKPPDPRYVRHLPVKFPGTAISIKFPLPDMSTANVEKI